MPGSLGFEDLGANAIPGSCGRERRFGGTEIRCGLGSKQHFERGLSPPFSGRQAQGQQGATSCVEG